ncbi:TnsA endonuclease N-terminal domain-containing protein [uncultured Herbaspirillum sp.]|uniref:TnsA endonuclease N-terminal domain-containing protein n=1 Tax=uncultured Herbaspirillum sp. TaxID=160236 RepID=UPI0025841BD4|nr:TnsA endonuclease N-terminal domain-containing protein [uncultured Herbaspirillum sp.]
MEQIGAGRRIVRRNPHRIVGTISFPTLGNADREWESVVERDAYAIIGYCGEVVGINTQPFSFTYESGTGKKATYTPDAQILFKEGREILLEVKPAIFALADEEFERLSAIKRHCNLHGAGFDVLTDLEIQTNQVRLENIFLLRRFFSTMNLSEAAHLAEKILGDYGPQTVNQLTDISGGALSGQTIFSLIGDRRLSIDWGVPLTLNSKIWFSQTNPTNLSYGELRAEAETNRLVGESALGCGKEIQRVMALEKASRRPVLPPFAWGIG